MNWNPFLKKKSKDLVRHEALLTAIAKVHSQVVDLDGRVGKVELLVGAQARAITDELLKELGEMREALVATNAKALERLDESLGSDVAKGLEGLKLWLTKELAATREAVAKVVPALVGDAKQRQMDHLEVAREGREQVARIFPLLDTLGKLPRPAPGVTEVQLKDHLGKILDAGLLPAREQIEEQIKELSQRLEQSLEAVHKDVLASQGEKHQLYDIQVRLADDSPVAIGLHDDPELKWAASDGRPPFKLQQRYLTAEQAEAIRARLPR